MTETTVLPEARPEAMAPSAVADRHLAAYGEPDPIRRRALLEAAWVPEGLLVEPPLDPAKGHDQLDDLFATVQSHYPGHRFRRTTDVDAHHDFGRYGWELVGPDGTVAFGGLDVVEFAPDGRLAGVVGFLGDLAVVGAA
jgi:hypothetical protein